MSESPENRWALVRGPIAVLLFFLAMIFLADLRRDVSLQTTLISIVGWAVIGGGFIWLLFDPGKRR